ncbi:1162_t:CDS:2 [Funneliformis caledonium]|uniref:1162_t:CDS:1 n=1 Tax=Funneliformis caledonium TaxID=1117310 RepID=A0A9N9HED9_9GLOM|nr:1162_t:CDS:2 [Funneliformis caledonium]
MELVRKISSPNETVASPLDIGSINYRGYVKVPDQSPEYLSPANATLIDQVVSVQTIQAHVNLLIRFTKRLEQNDSTLLLGYLLRAEQRYILWLNLLDELKPKPESIPIPPLDVSVFWSAHMTNPSTYQEDLIRMYGEHMMSYDFPLIRMDSEIDTESVTIWQEYSKEPYLLEYKDDRPFLIRCPFCMKDNLIEQEKFIQLKMKLGNHQCSRCEIKLDSDILSSKRMLNDIENYLKDERKCLAGTLLNDRTNKVDYRHAKEENRLLFDQDIIREIIRLSSTTYTGKPSPPSLYIPNIQDNCNWKVIREEIIRVLYKLDSQSELSSLRKDIHDRVISSYEHLITPFSLDLIGTVLRYKDAVCKILMNGEDWDEEDVLNRSTTRYQKFLSLKRKHPDKGLIPTVDILNCWFIHMLHPIQYQTFTLSLVGKILNHEGPLDEKKMVEKFAKTCLLWYKNYNEPYSSDNPSKEWKKRKSRIVMSVVFPVYGLFVAQKLWKLSKTHDKKMGNGSTI